VAVQAFLDRQLAFIDIPRVIENVMNTHHVVHDPDMTAILEADAWARKTAEDLVQSA
jgi:1-deoxy-D-xylulose-5-phosphate reductoisomerase